MSDEGELLRRFADGKSQEAFTELVRRKVDLVYAAALRQTGGDVHLAKDVTQGVFVALAGQAGTLSRHAVLSGWLYTTTRFLATKAVRTQARWQRREQEANTMNAILHEPQPAWDELRPVIDDAMHELPEHDRTAILLRYFEALPLARVGAALGLSENAARMRVDRALEKLRGRLTQRGITSTAAALGGALSVQPVVAAPLGLASSIAKVSMLAPAMPSSGVGVGFLTGNKLTAAAVAALLGMGVYWAADNRRDAQVLAGTAADQQELARLQSSNGALKRQYVAMAAAEIDASASVAQPFAQLKALAALNKSRVVGRLQWTRLENSSLFITPEIAELLVLTPAEANALRGAVDEAQKEIAALAALGAVVQRSENAMVVDLQPNAAIRARYARLTATFRQSLGPERFRCFEEVGLTDALDALFYNFGLISANYVIRRDSSRPETPYALSHRAGPGVVAGNDPGRGGNLDRETLRQKLGAMDLLVPRDF